jgi:two-component system sensor histidine kinase PilS (NtrC family)
MVGESLASILEDRSPELLDVIVETQRRKTGTLRAEVLVIGPDASVPVGVTTTAVSAEKDESCSVTAIFTNITDQKRLEELKLRTERLEAVAELSASLAHEIKNPLASIRSSVEQLAQSSRADEDERFLANLVVRESDRLSGLLSEFIDFSRVRVKEHRELDLESLVHAAVRIVEKHPDCPAGTRIEVDAETTSLEGDEALLHGVLLNLMLNAAQASKDGVTITVEARKALASELPNPYLMGDSVLIKVSDDGPGIAEDLKEKIFEPFVSGRVGGSGLGLAIVQRAVLAHRGVVFVDSTPDVGTSFTVLLPKRRQTEADQ